jgi:hypothetical protein
MKLDQIEFDSASHLNVLQELMSLPRETLPRLSLAATQKALTWASEHLGLELISNEGNTPTFLLLPSGGTPAIVLFAAWHAEILPVTPAALEGGERLALAATLGALAAIQGSGGDRRCPGRNAWVHCARGEPGAGAGAPGGACRLLGPCRVRRAS